MKRFYLLAVLLLPAIALAQNRDTAQISITNFRLVEERTFSWRGTDTYFDMTSWDSAPYEEGYLAERGHGDSWLFRMNYRLLKPLGYDAGYDPGYPLIIMLHGAGESGNCWDQRCYYGTPNYNPNTYPTGAAEDDINKLLNNDHQLLHGGRQHLDARNRAGSKLPNDPSLRQRDFPGFVVFPQNNYTWGNDDARNSPVTHAIRIVRLLTRQYNIDQNRIYFHGLSMGGQGVLKAMKIADWLIAGAAAMSPIAYSSLEYDSVANIPLWVFQGGRDEAPRPSQTENMLARLREAGATPRYTLYPTLGHGTWNSAYAEPDFFSWLLSKNKANIHVFYGNPGVCGTTGAGVKLGVADGFPAYQWERDGQIIPGATTHQYIAMTPGTYRARFSRISATPAAGEWNRWSDPVVIGQQNPAKPVLGQNGSVVLRDLNNNNTARLSVSPEAANYSWYRDGLLASLPSSPTVQITSGPCEGPCLNGGTYTVVTSGADGCPSAPSDGLRVFFSDQAPVNIPAPASFSGALLSPTAALLQWNDNSNAERGYEIWRRRSTDNANSGWTMIALTAEDVTSYADQDLQPLTEYWYKIRAVSNTGRSEYAPGPGRTSRDENVILNTGGDNVAPAPPQNLRASVVATDIATRTVSVELLWDATTDNGAIREYKITAGQMTQMTGSAKTSFLMTGIPLNSDIAMTVTAIDNGNNESPPSSQVVVNTRIDGLFWEHSTGAFTDLSKVPQEIWDQPEFNGRTENIDLRIATQVDYYVARFYGYFDISAAGTYRFRLEANDGASLYIDGNLILGRDGPANDGSCPAVITNDESDLPLAAGVHTIDVRYLEYTGSQCLRVKYAGPDTGGSTAVIPDDRMRSYNSYTPPVPPAAPGSLTATATGMTSIGLAWDHPGGEGTAFEIFRANAADATFELVNRVSGKNYSDTSLAPASTYFYRVRAVTATAESAYSETVSARTSEDNEPPTAPDGLVFSSPTHSSVTLTWEGSEDNAGVAGYSVWVNGTVKATTPVTYYLLTGLTPGISYSVYVTAHDAGRNESAPSNTISFTTRSGTIFYSKVSGDLNTLSTWGQMADGTGPSPENFQINGATFIVANRSETSLDGPWKVEGNSSKVVIADGVSLTVRNSLDGHVEVPGTGKLILSHSAVPRTLNAGAASTVRYDAAATTVRPGAYGDLILAGATAKTLEPGVTEVRRDLVITEGTRILSAPPNQSKLVLWANLTVEGSPVETPGDTRVDIEFHGAGQHALSFGQGTLSLFRLKLMPSVVVAVVAPGAGELRTGSEGGGGLTLSTGAVLELSTHTLSVVMNGSVNGGGETGMIAANGGVVDINGTATAPSELRFTETANTLTRFRAVTATGTKIDINTPVVISHAVKVSGATIHAKGNITLVSTEPVTANLEAIDNGGTIVGVVRVQRYISRKPRTYRYLSTPVAGTVVADWQKYFAVTGPFEGADTGGTLGPLSSLFYYREPAGWVGYPLNTNPSPYNSSNAPIEKATGYAAFVRNEEPVTLEVAGQPFQGNISYTLTAPAAGRTDTGWNLLGNPYASTIRWSNDATEWTRSGVSSIVAVRNNTSTEAGQFQYYDAATGTWTGDQLVGGLIAQGQAFWVQAVTANPSLVITEKAKAEGQQMLYRDASSAAPHVRLSLSDGAHSDEAILAWTDFGTPGFEPEFDGVKRLNEGMFSFASVTADGVAVAINNSSDSFCEQRIYLSIDGAEPGSYTLHAEPADAAGEVGTITLFDHYTNTTHRLAASDPYVFAISDDPSTAGRSRLELLIGRPGISSQFATEIEDLCKAPVVVVTDAQPGVSYRLETPAGQEITSTVATSTTIRLPLTVDALSDGTNTFRLGASFEGCAGGQATKTVEVTYYKAPANLADDASVCAGASVTLTPIQAPHVVSYNWYDRKGNALVTSGSALETGPVNEELVFLAEGVLPNGCTTRREEVTVTPEAVAPPVIVHRGDTLAVESAAEWFTWSRGETMVDSTGYPYHVTKTGGAYTVTVTKGGCSLTSAAFIVTGADDKTEAAGITISPNPSRASGVSLTVKSPATEDLHVRVRDVHGRTLFIRRYEARAFGTPQPLGLPAHLSPGTYLVEVTQGSARRTLRLVITD